MKTLSVMVFTATLSCFSIQAMNAMNVDPDTLFIPDAGDPGRETIQVFNGSGMLIHSGTMVNHKKEGVFRNYTDAGNLFELQEYHHDVPDGVHLVFGDNISLEMEENYRKGLLHGRRLKYRYGGILKLREHYVNGKLDSLRISYYDNGFRQEESVYKNGLRTGVARWYNQSEQILIEYHYKNGILDGPAATFHNNGKPEQQGMYVDDREEGEWKSFDRDGKHIKSVFYKDGKVLREKVY